MIAIPEWLQTGKYVDGSERLEKTQLRLGFVPLTDCAPLAVAKERRLFQKYGLEVELCRQRSWASIRDKVAAGVLDGAQMLAAMPIATSLGLGEVRKPMVTALSLDLNGNAVTVSNDLFRQMREADPDAVDVRATAAQALAKIVHRTESRPGSDLDLAIVFPFSTHNYLLRYWLASAGINPDRHVRLRVVPPPFMVDSLRNGEIAGYCVGEPWNERAVAEGIGRSLIADYEIWNNHPEKVFGVTLEWAERYPNTHKAVLMALLEAAEWIDQVENRDTAAEIVARKAYVNAEPEAVKTSMLGSFRYDCDQAAEAMPDFNVFYRYAATFPWVSHAIWFLTQMYRWGQIERPLNMKRVAEQVYRPDLYREAARELGFPYPTRSLKLEGLHDEPQVLTEATEPLVLGADCFVDGRVFNPDDPVGYLAGFELHSRSVAIDELAELNPCH